VDILFTRHQFSKRRQLVFGLVEDVSALAQQCLKERCPAGIRRRLEQLGNAAGELFVLLKLLTSQLDKVRMVVVLREESLRDRLC
jgi:hypothetical protein